ncbi:MULTISPECIES: acyltransferase family protein [unclassified Bradyrhizobium]|uniref:acyltransferase family protein n=1 Tax=unclassified Bradyrhizobium TaxID=2631580 RepID=UPI002915FFB1|nr:MULTISPECIES: acyltransferase family protein [unclassified Bradyrhizobium]
MSLRFRADIDYLRAVAVISVIGFHYGIPGFQGGFVGVDIFFVISGHLITRLIWAGIHAGNFSFWEFYDRRARRLLPALYVMVLGTGIGAWFLAAPDDYRMFFESAVSTVLFSSNIFFWLQAGYFDLPSVGKVLIHTWSLAVEEQFYFLFPLLTVLWSKRFRDPTTRLSLILLLAGTVALCIADELLIKNSAPAAFYLSPLRGWEFLIGGFSFLLERWSPADVRWRLAMAIAGALLMLAPVVLFTGATRLPGFQALIPCLGAASFIMAFNREDGRPIPLPFRRTGLFLGRISYSLYLWHWPVFVLGTVAMPITWAGSPTAITGLLACSFALAYLSYRLVETPARGRTAWLGIRTSGLIATAATILLAIGAAGILQRGFPDRFPQTAQRMLRYTAATMAPLYGAPNCFLEPDEPFAHYRRSECLTPASNKINILLFGDSTAAHYVPSLRNRLDPNRYHLLQLTSGNCSPFVDLHHDTSRNCDELNATFRRVLRDHGIAAVILSAHWRNYIDLYGSSDTSKFDAYLEATLSATENAGIPVLMFGPSIEFPGPLAANLVRYELTHLPTGEMLKVTPASFTADTHVAALAGRHRNVQFVSVLAAVCHGHTCPLTVDPETTLVWDTIHLTPEGSRHVVQRLAPALDGFLDRLHPAPELVQQTGAPLGPIGPVLR